MRVLQINTFLGYTSTGNIAYSMYKNIIEHDGECIIAYGRNSSIDCHDSFQIGKRFDYLCHGIITRINDKQGYYSKRATQNLCNFIDQYKPDIVHFHNLHGYYINIEILMRYLSKTSIPIVWTLHDCWSFTGHCPYYSNINCLRWQEECYNCPQKIQYPASYAIDNSKYNYQWKNEIFHLPSKMILVPVSFWLGNEVKKSFLKDRDMEVIHNGIDLNTFKPTKSVFREKYNLSNKIILLAVAIKWEPRKGLNDLVVLSELLEDKYQIVIVGLSKKQTLLMPKRILCFEPTSTVQELVEIYSTADILINTSREETFGLVIAESMACGTPVVAYNTTAIPELIDEKTGKTVTLGDINKIKIAIEEIITGNNLHQNCLNKAHQFFDRQDMMNKYWDLYQKII